MIDKEMDVSIDLLYLYDR